ncbi:hypothetical protein ACF0H5_022102 [Mactra antiquata]
MNSLVLIALLWIPAIGCVCINGWVNHNGSCYHFSHDKEQMTGAMYMCNVMGGRLVEIYDKPKMDYLSRIASLFDRNFWIGLNGGQSQNLWVWLDSKRTLQNTVYTGWDVGQPNTTGYNHYCVGLGFGTGKWRVVNCFDEMHFICESPDVVGPIIIG